MKVLLTQAWKDEIIQKIETGTLDFTSQYNQAIQFAVLALSKRNKPFKLYNLGAGIKRITSDSDICPCCKKKAIIRSYQKLDKTNNRKEPNHGH